MGLALPDRNITLAVNNETLVYSCIHGEADARGYTNTSINCEDGDWTKPFRNISCEPGS